MKTLDEWNESGLGLSEYLTEPCQIDEELSLYIMEIVAPHYLGTKLGQGGDAEYSEPGFFIEEDVSFYMTVSEVNDKHFYLGILPEFKQ